MLRAADHWSWRASHIGWTARAMGLAAVLAAGTAVAQSHRPPIVSTSPPTTQPQSGAEQPSAIGAVQDERAFRYMRSMWMLNMARSLAPAPLRPNLPPVDQTLWQLDRRCVLLEAALALDDRNDRALWDLYVARGETAGASKRYAKQTAAAAARLRAEGKNDQARQLDRLAEQADRAADDLRLKAAEVLSRYVDLLPFDTPAWAALLNEKLSLMQSAEDRIRLLSEELKLLEAPQQAATSPDGGAREQASSVRDEKISTVLSMLADYRLRQGGPGDEARALLERAVKLTPLNRAAKSALLALMPDKLTPEGRLDLALTSFRLSPADLAAVAEISSLLVRYGVYELTVQVKVDGKTQDRNRGAVGFYDYEAAVRADLFKGQPPPVDFLVQQGQALALAGRLEQAGKVLRQGIAQSESGTALAGGGDPLAPLPAVNLSARMLLIESLDPIDKAAADAERKLVLDYYRSHRDKPAFQTSAPLLAHLSWFFLRVQNDPKQALELARQALKADPRDPLAVRSIGAAQAASGEVSLARAAVSMLTPLSATDPWSAFYLGVANGAAGDTDKMSRLLEGLASDWPGHPAGRAARKQLGAKAPPLPPTGELAKMLTALPQGLFEFYRTPARFANIQVRLIAGPEPYDPVSLLLQLANTSAMPAAEGVPAPEGFPVAVGQGLMVWPHVLISAAVHLPGEAEPRRFIDYCQVRIHGPQLLLPGQSITAREVIDVGPVDQLLRLTPQAEKVLSFQAVINPAASTTGDWIPGPGGYPIQGQFVRKGLSAGPDSLAELNDNSRAGPVRARIAANRMLGSLLAEQQLAADRKLAYQVRTVPTYRLANRLEEVVADQDPEVRAFLGDALYPAGLTDRLRAASIRQLGDANWLVRLLAVRLVGDRIGQSASRELTSLAAEDKDQLVRRLAQSYLDQWAGRP